MDRAQLKTLSELDRAIHFVEGKITRLQMKADQAQCTSQQLRELWVEIDERENQLLELKEKRNAIS